MASPKFVKLVDEVAMRKVMGDNIETYGSPSEAYAYFYKELIKTLAGDNKEITIMLSAFDRIDHISYETSEINKRVSICQDKIDILIEAVADLYSILEDTPQYGHGIASSQEQKDVQST